MLSSPLDISTPTQPDSDDEYETSQIDVKPRVSPTPNIRDVFIQSQTGSGKTLTYLLPIIQTLLPLSKLSYIDRSIGTLAIILAPTRELAGQITKVLEQILSLSMTSSTDNMTRWLVPGLLTGGSTRTHEKARLRKGVPILVSTPGRLLDHLQNTASFQCGKTMFLVLDEADRLMDLGFEETVRGIIKALDGRRRLEIASERGEGEEESKAGMMKWPFWGRGRRTILCSATVDAKVQKLSGDALHDPITFRGTDEEKAESKGKSKVQEDVEKALEEAGKVELPKIVDEDKFTPPSQLAQKFVVVPTKLRLVALVSLLRTLVGKGEGVKVIVFLSSTDSVDYHWKLLGGVQMSRADLQVEAKVKDEEEPKAESADEDGEPTISRAKPKKPKSKSLEEPITLTSPLFPSTTLHRLHGSLPLPIRQKSLASFSSPSTNPSILICTSVASRGLDLPLVRAVVQFDLPTESGATEYVHRVGRTARAGKGGEAWAVVGTSEEGWVNWVEGKMDKSGSVKLRREGVEDVLKKGFGGKGYEYEARATEVQLGFERWVLQDDKVGFLSLLPREALSLNSRADE